jgi:CDP-diacylglycerol---serine O-phosphatidyltransferase
MHRLRAISVLPTLFTLGNLVCGFFAIVAAARIEAPTSAAVPSTSAIHITPTSPTQVLKDFNKENDVHNGLIAGWLIFLAMIFDALDGHVARLAKTTSDFGAQLDSLCDVVTFGVAPAFLLVKITPSFSFEHSQMIWIIAAAYACCAALRLARFNVETDEEDDHLNFSGLPSPAAGAVVASFAILFYTLRRDDNPFKYAEQADMIIQWIAPFATLTVALLMVSRIPYPHVVNQVFRSEKSFGHVVAVLFAMAAIMVVRGYAVPIVCIGFALSGPLRYAWQELFQRKPHDEPLF